VRASPVDRGLVAYDATRSRKALDFSRVSSPGTAPYASAQTSHSSSMRLGSSLSGPSSWSRGVSTAPSPRGSRTLADPWVALLARTLGVAFGEDQVARRTPPTGVLYRRAPWRGVPPPASDVAAEPHDEAHLIGGSAVEDRLHVPPVRLRGGSLRGGTCALTRRRAAKPPLALIATPGSGAVASAVAGLFARVNSENRLFRATSSSVVTP
jgi:hypothetical protein